MQINPIYTLKSVIVYIQLLRAKKILNCAIFEHSNIPLNKYQENQNRRSKDCN